MHNDPDFAGREINIVGFAQGGLIARAVVQRCEGLNVHTLFTFGAMHAGVKWFDLGKKHRGRVIDEINHIGHYVQEHVML